MLDSDDEELCQANKFDEWNRARKEFGTQLSQLAQMNMQVMGIGVPLRQPSYILGRPTSDFQGGNNEMSIASVASIGSGGMNEA